jgi:dTDP-4-amino-4,6-dideoxygalactose transaminase
VRDALAADGIASAIFYALPLHRQPAYADANRDLSLPVAERLAGRVLSLPIHPFLDEAAIERVAATIRRVLGRA